MPSTPFRKERSLDARAQLSLSTVVLGAAVVRCASTAMLACNVCGSLSNLSFLAAFHLPTTSLRANLRALNLLYYAVLGDGRYMSMINRRKVRSWRAAEYIHCVDCATCCSHGSVHPCHLHYKKAYQQLGYHSCPQYVVSHLS